MCIEPHTFHYHSLKWLRYWMEELVKHSVEKVRIKWSHFTRTLFSRACDNTNTYSCNNSSYFMPCVSYFFAYAGQFSFCLRQRANVHAYRVSCLVPHQSSYLHLIIHLLHYVSVQPPEDPTRPLHTWLHPS